MERREGARGFARPPLGAPCDRAARAPCEGARTLAIGCCAPLALHSSSVRCLRRLDTAARIVGAPRLDLPRAALEPATRFKTRRAQDKPAPGDRG